MSTAYPNQHDAYQRGLYVPRCHELKCWSKHFNAITYGYKTFEVRKNDRDYQVGDLLILREWNEVGESYTGSACMRQVTHILEGGQFGIAEGYVVMSISRELPSHNPTCP